MLVKAAAGCVRHHTSARTISNVVRLQLKFLPALSIRSTRSLSSYKHRGTSQCVTRHHADTADTSAVETKPGSAYIHLPFCKRKCFYCDFPVEAVGKLGAQSSAGLSRMTAYVDVICREIAATPSCGRPLKTVFFGGGTPSLLPPELLRNILIALERRHGIDSNAEISLEADPGTFDLGRLQEYMTLGVNRVSVGVQAFQEELLQASGRGHSLLDVHAALETVAASGIRSWSVDLISGLPHLDAHKWRESLQAAVASQPQHISVYDLQVEEGTPFARWYSPGAAPLPSDDATAEMYAEASDCLRGAGYEHYEISNYALPGHRCQHNQVYWHRQPFHAFGLGAASYLDGRRFSRPKKMREYVDWVEQLAAGGGQLPGSHLPAESQEEQLLDQVMLSLRTADGLALGPFDGDYGAEAGAVLRRALRRHCEHGTALALAADGSSAHSLESAARVRLADPAGFLLSNGIISDVFAEFSRLQSPATASST